MEITDTHEVIEALNAAAGADETWRVETFSMHRVSKVHGHQDITVEVLDRGGQGSPRYHVSATSEDGKACSGNSGDNLGTVIATVHWYQLDR